MFDERHINVIIDEKGNCGKSSLVAWLEHHKYAEYLPPFNNIKELMGFVIDRPHHAYLFDLPRALSKTKLAELLAGIEQIKDGVAYDPRYRGRKTRIEQPAIWVFTNEPLNIQWLSADRWLEWVVARPGMVLMPYIRPKKGKKRNREEADYDDNNERPEEEDISAEQAAEEYDALLDSMADA